MFYDFDIHRIISLERIEFYYYVIGALVIGIIIGMCIIIVGAKKPTSTRVDQRVKNFKDLV